MIIYLTITAGEILIIIFFLPIILIQKFNFKVCCVVLRTLKFFLKIFVLILFFYQLAT